MLCMFPFRWPFLLFVKLWCSRVACKRIFSMEAKIFCRCHAICKTWLFDSFPSLVLLTLVCNLYEHFTFPTTHTPILITYTRGVAEGSLFLQIQHLIYFQARDILLLFLLSSWTFFFHRKHWSSYLFYFFSPCLCLWEWFVYLLVFWI